MRFEHPKDYQERLQAEHQRPHVKAELDKFADPQERLYGSYYLLHAVMFCRKPDPVDFGITPDQAQPIRRAVNMALQRRSPERL